MDADQVVTADFALLGLGSTATPAATTSPADSALLLRVTLELPGGRAEVLVDGRRALLLERGEALLVLTDAAPSPIVEGRLLDASGPGTWRFELVARDHLPGEGIRPLVGETLWMTPTGAAYRLRGVAGEAVAFRFRAPQPEDSRSGPGDP
jgi:hypothetical protein